MRTTEILSQEHRVIEQVLACLEKLVSAQSDPRRFDWTTAGSILDFLKNFADRCHHGKEEERLFPAMEARGFSPTTGPTAVMRQEHERSRELMAAMSESVRRGGNGDSAAVLRFERAARDYVQLLREHIHKEDSCLFPMAANFLSDSDCELVRQFEEIEHEPRFDGQHEKYLKLADDLAQQFDVPRCVDASPCLHPCGCKH